MQNRKSKEHRILVVEDLKSISSLMVHILTTAGYVVDLAEDGEAGLEKAHSFAPHLILLDIMLPKIHGIDVLKSLKQDVNTRSIGVIVCTAKNYKSDEDQIRELGSFDIINKPFEPKDFLNTVERYFSAAKITPASPAFTVSALPLTADEIYMPQIRQTSHFFKLWGTRGSIPVSGARYVRHGGNTSCFEIGNGESSVIIDAGSGIRDLGFRLMKSGGRKILLLITHTHWDHIQGFPFFTPLYYSGIEVDIYGASTFGKDLKSIFRGQLDRDYFPVQFEDMQANVEFHTLTPEPIQIGDMKITWEFTQHPAATVGYKIETGGITIAYITDNEFLQGYLGPPHPITMDSPILVPHQRMVHFVAGVDLLIHEAQYTNEEYQDKIGWGHSSISNGCLLASLARVKRWIIIHHDPMHDDDFLQDKLNLTKEIMRSLDYPIEITHGYDGLTEYF